MNQAQSQNSRAFTLLELLAAMAVLLIIMAALYQVSDQISKAWQLGERRTEVNQNARLVLEMMASELEGAMASTNSPTGTATNISFLHQEDSHILPGITTGLICPTPPNDQIFFISNASDTTGQGYIDLCEYGYMVVYVREDYSTMKGGYYYLLRHLQKSDNAGWNIFDGSPATWDVGWPSTPTVGVGTTIKAPILDNVLSFELYYETRGIAPSNAPGPNGTAFVDTWRNAAWYGGTNGPPYPSDYGITDPEHNLPNAVHIRLTVLDRRTATRASAIMQTIGGVWTNGIPFAYLECVPFSPAGESFLTCTNCPWASTNTVVQPLRTVLRQGVQTYYRTVNLRNSK